jgi:tetratricopeptide (TPR) repeat protein
VPLEAVLVTEGLGLMRFRGMLARTWNGVRAKIGPPAAATVFRQADQCRTESRYERAAALVSRGLEQDPDSAVGHLLAGYIHVARREAGPAKLAFQRVLELDRHHPRALLGLARLAIEEDDLPRARALLDRALQVYPVFPEAAALQDIVVSRCAIAGTARAGSPSAGSSAPVDGLAARDIVVTRPDGALVRTTCADERATLVSQHMKQVLGMSSTTLARAGLGSLRRGIIDTDSGTTLVVSDVGLVFTATLDLGVDVGAALLEVERVVGADRRS